ncbi:MAG: hypothetical protein ABI203_11505, partial [Mucilaginibacter sp.]
AIRGLMERSSKFISLSGLSGILAGIYALIGAGVVYYFFYPEIMIFRHPAEYPAINDSKAVTGLSYGGDYIFHIPQLIIIAAIVFIASLVTAIVLSSKKAKQKGQSLWSKTSRTILFNMAVPLVSGGVLILVHIFRGHYGLVAPSCLVFYGLALVSASNFTFTDVKYLGLCEIALGLVAACLPGHGLLFWAIGFGVLHIIYGSMMYLKYDR